MPRRRDFDIALLDARRGRLVELLWDPGGPPGKIQAHREACGPRKIRDSCAAKRANMSPSAGNAPLSRRYFSFRFSLGS